MNSLSIRYYLALCILILGNASLKAESKDEFYDKSDSIPATIEMKKAHEKPWTIRRFSVSAGGFFPVNHTSLQMNGSANNGTSLDLEKELNFGKHTPTFLLGLNGRFGRNRVLFNYLRIHRDKDWQLEKEIVFGDNTYPVNAEINAYFNVDIYRLSYGYSFFQNKHFDVGATFGFHLLDVDLGISVIGKSAGLNLSDSFGIPAPLPNFGIWGTYAISSKFAVTAEVDYLALKIENIKGRIFATDVNVQYRLSKHFDVYAGYMGLWVKVDATRKQFNGDFKWGYNGPLVKVSYSFDHF